MKYFIAILMLAILGCAPNSRIIASWRNDQVNVPQPAKQVYIAALTSNTILKSKLEGDIEAAFTKLGVKCVKSINTETPTYGKDSIVKSDIVKQMHKSNCDALVTVTLLKRESETRYVGGSYYPMSRFSFYGGFQGYYNYWYPYAYDPGYYTRDDVFYIETNLYDGSSEALLWSAQSESYNYNLMTQRPTDFATEIAEALVKMHLVAYEKVEKKK